MATNVKTPTALPRVSIQFCTQCRWMLRAAYFAQELLSTFGTTLGEVALVPGTGGVFTVELTYAPTPSQDSSDAAPEIKKALLWDRKTEGGFPETKVLKQRVRDHIDPKKDLGHSDVGGKKKATSEEEAPLAPGTNPRAGTQEGAAGTGDDGAVKRNADGTICEDCR